MGGSRFRQAPKLGGVTTMAARVDRKAMSRGLEKGQKSLPAFVRTHITLPFIFSYTELPGSR